MVAVLRSYLLQHKSLSLPGMGTLYIERIPAQVDFINRQILPPVYLYRFNKYFDAPDRDFFAYIAREQNMADYESIRWFNEWSFDLRNHIRQEGIYWEGIGTLSTDTNGEVVFEAASPIPVYLNPVPAERVIRVDAPHTMLVGDREVTNKEMSGYLAEEHNITYVEKESWWIYALILAALVLIVCFFHFYKHGFRFDSLFNQQSVSIR